jgi:hypothetical protein
MLDRNSIPDDRRTCGREGLTTYSAFRQIHFGEVGRRQTQQIRRGKGGGRDRKPWGRHIYQ